MGLRVLGIDPGLTRCGVGVVDVGADRRAGLVEVSVLRSAPGDALERRLLAVGDGIEEALERCRPDAVALERVFAQHNLHTVMGVAQISGVALVAAARRGIPIALYTPSEVKAAVTGYGAAEKKQVQAMIARILGLDEVPRPADAADALALAVCHAWRGASDPRGAVGAPTPAQQAWRAAERSARSSGAARRLGR